MTKQKSNQAVKKMLKTDKPKKSLPTKMVSPYFLISILLVFATLIYGCNTIKLIGENFFIRDNIANNSQKVIEAYQEGEIKSRNEMNKLINEVAKNDFPDKYKELNNNRKAISGEASAFALGALASITACCAANKEKKQKEEKTK